MVMAQRRSSLSRHVRAGWDEAISQMSKNQIAKLTISADYAYGARGYPPMYVCAQVLPCVGVCIACPNGLFGCADTHCYLPHHRSIPPHQTLIFEVELISFAKPK